VRRDDVVELRGKVVATPDEKVREESADVTVLLKDGRREHVFVEHAIGSLERPMTDQDLDGKFHSLADPVIGKARASSLVEACWRLGNAPNVRAIAQGATP